MIRLLEFLIAAAIVAAIFLIVGLVLPSKRGLQETIETNRGIGLVYDTVNSFRRWPEWNMVTVRDPAAQINVTGPEEGVGAKLEYRSNVSSVGNGSWEITESVPNESVKYAIESASRGSNKRSTIGMAVTGASMRNVTITQDYHVNYGFDLLGRYAGLYVSGNVGDDLRMGLERLAALLASVPNVDYNDMGSRFDTPSLVETPAENLLVVNAGVVERNNDAIRKALNDNREWIRRAMDANNLSAAGPLRIRTIEMSRENWAFEVVQPVRRGSAAASTEGDSASAAAPAAQAELTNLNLSAPVTYERAEAGKAAVTNFNGAAWSELETARDALRAWAATRGYVVQGRPYEALTDGVDAIFTADGKYQLSWPLQ